MSDKRIAIVIPCFNEEHNLAALLERLNSATGGIRGFSFTYLFVDDGSADRTFEKVREASRASDRIRGIQLSRNFGSHIAISAGIDHASGFDAAIVISADLQEPPEMIGQLISKWQEGFEVVWTVREKRAQSRMGKALSRTFYRLFIKASGLKNYPKEGPSAFFLLDKKVCRQWGRFRETNRMIIGMIAWMGFRHAVVRYEQTERHSGRSSFTFMKLVKLAIDSFVSFSFAPIRFISYMGIVVSLIGFLYAIFLIIGKIFFGTGPTGWTSIMVIVLILGGIQLITLGILGEYVWRGVEESRNRPLYIVSGIIGPEGEAD